MTYMTKPFIEFVFAVAPYWLPLLIVYLVSIYLLIMRERFDPRTFIFWMAVVLTLPFLGFVLYLVFGSTIYSRWRFSRKHREDARFLGGDGDPVTEADGPIADVVREAGGDVYTRGNSASFFWGRDQAVQSLVQDIMSAERRIVMTFRRMPYVRDEVFEAVRRKAEAGLEVLILTSTLGFGRTKGIRELRSLGARHRTFNRPLYAMFSLRPANRDYRSFMVVDGRVAYEGRGAFLRLEGPSASRLEARFLADWSHASGEELRPSQAAPVNSDGVGVQVVSDGPDQGDSSPMCACYTRIVTQARRTLRICTTHLMPNDEVYATIRMAVLSGVKVDLLLPRKGTHWYQSWNSLAASNSLMMDGVRVFFADRMLTKCVVSADGEVCCVGSGPYSSRSLRNDFHTCCVVYGDTAAEVDRCFDEALEDSVECLPEEYRGRSLADMFRIAIARMLMFFN